MAVVVCTGESWVRTIEGHRLPASKRRDGAQCGYVWEPRDRDLHRACPACRSPWWAWRDATNVEQAAFNLGGVDAVTALLAGEAAGRR